MHTKHGEKEPLLQRSFGDKSGKKSASGRYDNGSVQSGSGRYGDGGKGDGGVTVEDVQMKRHITLPYAVAIMMGNVIGSGIFLSPKGVTANSGSVGASLVVWAVTGIYNLCQALCYAELGTVIPRAGGDYAYLYEILGPLFGFMTAWIHVVVIASSSCAAIARTAALYIVQPFGLECNLNILTVMAIFFIVTLAAVNGISTVWGTKVHTVFTVAKVAALLIVIIGGVVKMAQGYTENFENAFEGTNTNAGSLSLAILDGYFAYKGWELVNALPEEMVSPTRDLPRCVWISMISVTGIYVLTNMAYFSVLTPEELVASDAVALSFAERALGPLQYVIPPAVALSCMGAVNGDFLSNSRYVFAGGRYRQVPRVFGYIHGRHYTPLLAIALLALIAIVYCVFTDLQQLQEYASLSVQVKMLLCLSALFYLRYKAPDLHRPMKVNTIVAVVTFLLMIAIVALSFYKSPLVSGIGIGVFLAGVPLYGLIVFVRDRPLPNKIMDHVTLFLQRALFIVPETHVPEAAIGVLAKT